MDSSGLLGAFYPAGRLAIIETLRRHQISLAAGTLMLLLVTLLPFPRLPFLSEGADLLERWELRTHDWRFAQRGPRQPRAKIVLAEIRNTTLDHWPEEPSTSWGYHYADAIRNGLNRYGATAIGFDVIQAVDTDIYLEKIQAQQRTHPIEAFVQAIAEGGDRVYLANVYSPGQGLVRPLAEIAWGRIGYTNYLIPQRDEVIRRVGLWNQAGNETHFHLTTLLAAAALRERPGTLLTHALRQETSEGYWINYTGTDLPAVSLEDLAEGRLNPADQEAVRGAILLVGPTHGTSQDKHPGPYQQDYYGVEINGQIVHTLLDDCPLRRQSHRMEALLTVGLGAVFLLACSFWAPRGTITVFASQAGLLGMLLGLWWLAALYVFARHNTLLPVVQPFLGLALPFLTLHGVRSVEEKQQRLQAEIALGRHISPQVRDFLRDHPGFTGQQHPATILLMDIRGFTRYCKDHSTEEVLAELNRFWNKVVPIVQAKGGLLSKFTGDGFLAVFGLPLHAVPSDLNAAQQALHAVLEMLEVARSHCRRDGGVFHVGCSLHTGEVMFGYVGVEDRIEFTVIGDTVNLAARLEELNKVYDSELVLSEETYRQLERRPVRLTGPILESIRGREDHPLQIYALFHCESENEH